MLEKHCKIESMEVIKRTKLFKTKTSTFMIFIGRSVLFGRSFMAPHMSIFPTKNPLIKDLLFLDGIIYLVRTQNFWKN